MIICPIKIEETDNLSKQVCRECLEIVVNAYQLREISNKSDRQIRKQVKSLVVNSPFKVKEESFFEDEEIIHYRPDPIFTKPLPKCVEPIPVTPKPILFRKPVTYQKINYRVNLFRKEKCKSLAWVYFGLLTDLDGNSIDTVKNYFFCSLCVENKGTLSPKYVKNISTTIMMKHLLNEHKIKNDGTTDEIIIEKPAVAMNTTVLDPEVTPVLKDEWDDDHFFKNEEGEGMDDFESNEFECEICKKKLKSKISFEFHNQLVHSNYPTCSNNTVNELLVDCSRKGGKSFAWQYFGFLVNAKFEVLDHEYFYCRVCVEDKGDLKSRYRGNTSTSVMLKHLMNQHNLTEENTPKMERVRTSIIRLADLPLKASNDDKFTCDGCGKEFDSKANLRSHMRRKHIIPLGPSNFTCEVCGKGWKQNCELNKHMRTHSDIKYSCHRCPAKLASLGSLKLHQETHSHVKSCICDICGSAYKSSRILKKHMHKHDSSYQKKFSCEYCHLKFHSTGRLKKHTLTHLGVKPHECDYCDRAYLSSGDLVKHLRTHLGENIYKCEYCTESFRLQVDLREHYQVHYQKKDEQKEEGKSASTI
ncbi:unnamed protein product [Diamesa tonsa]